MAYKGPQVVVGPASAVDDTVPRFDTTAGDIIQTSSVVISDADAVSGITQLDVDNIQIDGNTIASTDTNGNVVIAPDGDGTVSVTAAPIVPSTDRADSLGSATNSWDNVFCDGVTFDDGTNVLSAYEEGTWTPVLEFGGGSTGITYTNQAGTYTRIGNLCFIFMRFTLSSKGTDTGNAIITGLPLVPASTTYIALSRYQNLTYGSGRDHMMGGITTSTSEIALVQVGDGNSVTSIDNTQFADTTQIYIQGMYRV